MAPDSRPRVYGASKLKHARMWHGFRQNFPQVELVSRWIDWPADNTDMETLYREWMRRDLLRAEYLILYATRKNDVFKGATQEIGSAVFRELPLPIIICSPLNKPSMRAQLGQIVDTTLVHHTTTLAAAVQLVQVLHAAQN
jgi:hypothetical protein